MHRTKHLIKQSSGGVFIRWCIKNKILLEAIMLYMTYGYSKKSLYQLRNAISLKIQNKLRKKFKKEIEELHSENGVNLVDSKQTLKTSDGTIYNKVSEDKAGHTVKNNAQGENLYKTVWIFWWQGIENAPDLVKVCYRSVRENMKDWRIVLITEKNYKEYTDIPVSIIDKVKRGVITLTHFSDILRLDLLIRHGGLWLDATVLCTSGNIPKTIFSSDLFVYQTQKPGADGKATLMSSWCMWAKSDNHILKATQKLIYAYWERYYYMMDYFLLHQFMTIVLQEFPEEAKLIPPYTNENPHILLLHFFDKYNEDLWNDWKQQSIFHKLSYKLDKKKMEVKGTFYDVIIKNNTL